MRDHQDDHRGSRERVLERPVRAVPRRETEEHASHEEHEQQDQRVAGVKA